MFEALNWRKAPARTDVVLRNAADGIAQAGKNPIVLGSLAAMALLGVASRMQLSRNWFNGAWSALNRNPFKRSRATVMASRSRSNDSNSMSTSHNGRRGRKRKRKAAS